VFGATFDATGSFIFPGIDSQKLYKLVEQPILPACGDGRWHHVALTQGDGLPTARKTYLDGALLSSTTGMTYEIPSTGSNAAPLTLRVGSNGLGGDLLSGLVSDLRIYGRALSAAEVAALLQPPLLFHAAPLVA
jgi:hypothetical protein